MSKGSSLIALAKIGDTMQCCCACRYEKYTTDVEKKDRSKSTDKFMEAYEGLVEKVTDLTLVRASRTLPSSYLTAQSKVFGYNIDAAVQHNPFLSLQKSEAIHREKNRAQKASQYAELR